MKRALLLLISVVVLVASVATANQLEDELSREWKDKVVIIRALPVENHVQFDRDGNPRHTIHSGPWTSNAMFEIKSIKAGSKLHMTGKRVVNIFDNTTGRFRNIETKQDFDLEADLDRAWQTANDVRPLLDKLLLRDVTELVSLVPDYWTDCLKGTHRMGDWFVCGKEKKKTSKDAGSPKEPAAADNHATPASTPSADEPAVPNTGVEITPAKTEAATDAERTSSTAGGSISGEQPGSGVFRVGHGVTAPKALSTPDPAYDPLAKQVQHEGTSLLWVVINERGEPEKIRISRPTGAGLDDKAVEAVRRWKFKPATLDGRPVKVQVNIEVNFHLY